MFRINIALNVTRKDSLGTGPLWYQVLGQTSFILKWINVIFFYKAVLLVFMVYGTSLRTISKWFENHETAANHMPLPNSNPFWRFMEFIFELFLEAWNNYFLSWLKWVKKETPEKYNTCKHSVIKSHCAIELPDFIKDDPF